MSRSSNSLKVSDVLTTPIKLKYAVSYDSRSLSNYGIQVMSGSGYDASSPTTLSSVEYNEALLYRSVRHLYYSNYVSSSFLQTTSSFFNWEQSTAASGTLDADVRVFPSTPVVTHILTQSPNIGDTYQGGIVVYILQPTDVYYDPLKITGLIAAPGDAVSQIVWNFNTDTFAYGTVVGEGSTNTQDIIANTVGPTGSYAAGIAASYQRGGYTDWYLPSTDELTIMYNYDVATSNLGMSQAGYWSSTEDNQLNAYAYDVAVFGRMVSTAKSTTYAVRPARLFSIDRYSIGYNYPKVRVISIPRTVFGEKVSRQSFKLEATGSNNYTIIDDGNGNLIDIASSQLYVDTNYFLPQESPLTGYTAGAPRNEHVGNIIYSQGMVIITNQKYVYFDQIVNTIEIRNTTRNGLITNIQVNNTPLSFTSPGLGGSVTTTFTDITQFGFVPISVQGSRVNGRVNTLYCRITTTNGSAVQTELITKSFRGSPALNFDINFQNYVPLQLDTSIVIELTS